jgi:hypothetical protein
MAHLNDVLCSRLALSLAFWVEVRVLCLSETGIAKDQLDLTDPRAKETYHQLVDRLSSQQLIDSSQLVRVPTSVDFRLDLDRKGKVETGSA